MAITSRFITSSFSYGKDRLPTGCRGCLSHIFILGGGTNVYKTPSYGEFVKFSVFLHKMIQRLPHFLLFLFALLTFIYLFNPLIRTSVIAASLIIELFIKFI